MRRTALVGVLLAALAGCARSRLFIESDPSQARILVSKEADGTWEDFRAKKGQNVTPSTTRLKRRDSFWIKVTKRGWQDSEPQLVRGTRNKEDVHIRIPLRPAKDTVPMYVTSDPPGATVLVAESLDGDYHPWSEAEGEPLTPARGRMPVGDTFWAKVRMKDYEDAVPEYVHVDSDIPINLSFKLAKWKRKAEPAEKTRLTVTSDPSAATVLVSDNEFGYYEPWPPEKPLKLTPVDVMVGVGQTFWLKLRKDGYQTTEPRLITAKADEPITIHAVLKPTGPGVAPSPTVRPPAVSEIGKEAGIVASGYALVEKDPRRARHAAILDALGAAIQEKYGAQITARSMAQNYVLMENRIESLAEGRFASYDILEESQEGGLYQVKVLVRFHEDLLMSIQGENVSFIVGGMESAVLGSDELPMSSARRAAADTLIAASMRVVVVEDTIPGPQQLASLAKERQCDLALYVSGMAEPFDVFGQFHSYKTGIDYQLVTPAVDEVTDVIAEGHVEGVNEKRQLNARDAAIHALRDIGRAVAEEALQKLTARYDRAASHIVYVQGIANQREVETLVAELGSLPSVRHARLLAAAGDICEVSLIISVDARPGMASAVQRLRNIDLDVVAADLYTTKAMVRKRQASE